MPFSPPFVTPDLYVTMDIGSTPKIIFAKDKKCEIQGILVCNPGNSDTLITVTLLAERPENAPNEPTLLEGPIFVDVPLAAKETKDILDHRLIRLRENDILHGFTNFSGDRFNSFISYDAYNEVEE